MPLIDEDKVEIEVLKIRDSFNFDEMCELCYMLICTLQKKHYEEINIIRGKIK